MNADDASVLVTSQRGRTGASSGRRNPSKCVVGENGRVWGRRRRLRIVRREERGH